MLAPGYCVIYSLLLGVLVALILSFLQLYRKRDLFRTFVPNCSVLWHKAYIRTSALLDGNVNLNRMSFQLTRHYHLLGVYLAFAEWRTPDEPDTFIHLDTLYVTWLFPGAAQVTVGDRLLDVSPGDMVTIPVGLSSSILTPSPIHTSTFAPATSYRGTKCLVLQWKIHPFDRNVVLSRKELDYIRQKWMKKSKRTLKVVVVQKGRRREMYKIRGASQ